VVTTKDGTVLTCIPHAINGVLTPRHWRWILIDQRGSQYVGPAIDNDRQRGSLAKRVSDWWDARYELMLV